MAEGTGKKDTAKTGEHVAGVMIEIVIFFVVVIAIIYAPAVWRTLSRPLVDLVPSVVSIAVFLSVLLIMGIIYTTFRMSYLKKKNHLEKKREVKARRQTLEEVERSNPRWQRVLTHVNSDNPSDWRLAILEADILLGEILEKMGYQGEGIGEMLKKVEESDFNTINNAWEAHKVRNLVAHEGSDFALNQRDAKHAIALYQSVFQEFHSI